jgi:hypothetical protein
MKWVCDAKLLIQRKQSRPEKDKAADGMGIKQNPEENQ